MIKITNRWRGMRLVAMPACIFTDRRLDSQDIAVLCWLWTCEGETDTQGAIEYRFDLPMGMFDAIINNLKECGYVTVTEGSIAVVEIKT
jgi:hypothetical protein